MSHDPALQNDMNRCSICYEELLDEEKLYHHSCAKKMFKTAYPPVLPYANADLVELAKKAIHSRIAVPGVQAKLSLHLERKRNEGGKFTIVGLWGDYILKPPVAKYPGMPEIEDLTMHMAELVHIPTVQHCLIPLQSGELAYITRRIDRKDAGEKIHMEDMCQVTERLTEHKYNGSLEQVAKAIHEHSSNPLLDIAYFFEIVLFSYITGNADMHLKNFSFIYEDNMVMLAPAYDLLATRLLISEKDDPDESALTLNGKKSKIILDDFIAFAAASGLNKKQVENILKKFSKTLPALIAFIDKSFLQNHAKEQYKDIIRERALWVKLL